MDKERWQKLSLAEQMGNLGSEVSRLLYFEKIDDRENKKKAVERSLELLDLTIADSRWQFRLKEFLRLREVIADFFNNGRIFDISAESLNDYFLPFALKARSL